FATRMPRERSRDRGGGALDDGRTGRRGVAREQVPPLTDVRCVFVARVGCDVAAAAERGEPGVSPKEGVSIGSCDIDGALPRPGPPIVFVEVLCLHVRVPSLTGLDHGDTVLELRERV